MKQILIFMALVMLILSANSAMAETQNVIIKKKVGDNLYKTETGLYIETGNCEEKINNDTKAVLKYDKKSDSNEIIFENGSKCTVVVVFKQ